ncbi:peptidoglycan editing factor PgeF [Pontibacterium granulatum]|uniref:peptidoglycan editing factor PgeF n=1 Tax=Pontibacterium granulatum TaxID=2036029 RepID=UPI00249AA778|nr:peptidoglycan editing factor PgeF [Pontibacterium granulatum]MDI3325254.1 peptidoglycan editing factor PgeF [Pontibacterium granulatum]
MQPIIADWDAPKNVHALTSTRLGGVSEAPYAGLNLGDHVSDDPAAVGQNRQQLIDALGLQQSPQWLQQVHGITVVKAEADGSVPEADACWSDRPGQACIVMTADCLPVFFADKQGSRVAVAHAGWRGLADGVLEATLNCFDDPAQVVCWLGPAIGPEAFEVGGEVREQFCALLPASEQAFKPVAGKESDDKWLADIYQLARLRLNAAGVTRVSGGEHCTFSDADQFYSYRRDGVTGRMASVIWLD